MLKYSRNIWKIEDDWVHEGLSFFFPTFQRQMT